MSSLRAWLLGPWKLILPVLGLAGGALCAAIPVTTALDYPLSLVLAPALAVLFLLVGAFSHQDEPDSFPVRPWVTLLATWSATLVIPALSSVLGHICEPVYGLGFLVLGPLFSGACGLAAGQALQRWVPRWWAKAGLILLLVVGDVALAVAEFYFTPSVRFYGWLFGMYHGAIYDEAVRVTGPYLWLRLKDLMWVGALVIWGRPWFASFTKWVALAAAGLLLIASPWLRFTASGIPLAATLTHKTQSAHFAVWTTPGGKAQKVADRLAEDLEFRLWQQQQFLGIVPPDLPLDVYVYESPAQKESIMGAGKTTISKPWRREIHLHSQRPTESLIAHELAHVLLAEHSPTLLAVPSTWGLIPMPGVLEGAATAVERGSGTLTTHGWAKAMREIGRLPNMESMLSGLSFWGQSGALAYTASGSFIRFLLERDGPGPFLGLYGGQEFQQAYGKDVGQLLQEWNAFLDEVPVSEEDRLFAEFLLTQPSVFEKTCAYAGARCLQEVGAAIRAKRGDDALALARRALVMTDGDPRMGKELGRLLLALGDAASAREILGVDPGIDVSKANRSMEISLLLWDLDVRWLLGRGQDALKGYQELAQDSAARRLLGTELAWRLALASRPARLSLRRLLVAPVLDDEFETIAGELASQSALLPLIERLVMAQKLLGKLAWENQALAVLLPWLEQGQEAWQQEVLTWKHPVLDRAQACSLYVDLGLKTATVATMREQIADAERILKRLEQESTDLTGTEGLCFTPGILEAIADLRSRVLWKRQYLGENQEKTGQEE